MEETAPHSGEQPSQKRRPMEIYRPPGLRSHNSSNPNSPKNSVPSKPLEGSDVLISPTEPKPNTSSQQPKPSKETRSQSTKETEKAIGTKEIEEINSLLSKISLKKDQQIVDEFLQSNMESAELSKKTAMCLCRYAIEEDKQSQKPISRLCALLLQSPSGSTFHSSLMETLIQYFECRDQLRTSHFKVWIGFLSFLSDIYASLDFAYEENVVELFFHSCSYMLTHPILDTLKIEEIECFISSLLAVGYDLERNCPHELNNLKDCVRDAVIEVSEPWARKMLLLVMELAANAWKLPDDANNYYFN